MSVAESAHGNAATYFVDSHIAAGRATKSAFREVDGAKRSLTYGQLSKESSRVAEAFAAAGIRRESRAAMLCLDTIEYPQLFWGALKAGVVAVPLNTLLSASIYDSILRDSRATSLFVSAPLYHAVADIIDDNPYLHTIVVIGGEAPEGSITFETFIKGHAPAQTIAVLQTRLLSGSIHPGPPASQKASLMFMAVFVPLRKPMAARYWGSERVTLSIRRQRSSLPMVLATQ